MSRIKQQLTTIFLLSDLSQCTIILCYRQNTETVKYLNWQFKLAAYFTSILYFILVGLHHLGTKIYWREWQCFFYVEDSIWSWEVALMRSLGRLSLASCIFLLALWKASNRALKKITIHIQYNFISPLTTQSVKTFMSESFYPGWCRQLLAD